MGSEKKEKRLCLQLLPSVEGANTPRDVPGTSLMKIQDCVSTPVPKGGEGATRGKGRLGFV